NWLVEGTCISSGSVPSRMSSSIRSAICRKIGFPSSMRLFTTSPPNWLITYATNHTAWGGCCQHLTAEVQNYTIFGGVAPNRLNVMQYCIIWSHFDGLMQNIVHFCIT